MSESFTLNAEVDFRKEIVYLVTVAWTLHTDQVANAQSQKSIRPAGPKKGPRRQKSTQGAPLLQVYMTGSFQLWSGQELEKE